ncbi:hypothetical protein LY76DRAFT_526759, partial [Colletotrichum caudatum]
EVRWIHGDDNPADGFTKSSPNRALESLISHNTKPTVGNLVVSRGYTCACGSWTRTT